MVHRGASRRFCSTTHRSSTSASTCEEAACSRPMRWPGTSSAAVSRPSCSPGAARPPSSWCATSPTVSGEQRPATRAMSARAPTRLMPAHPRRTTLPLRPTPARPGPRSADTAVDTAPPSAARSRACYAKEICGAWWPRTRWSWASISGNSTPVSWRDTREPSPAPGSRAAGPDAGPATRSRSSWLPHRRWISSSPAIRATCWAAHRSTRESMPTT